jgi:hypothetical protein
MYTGHRPCGQYTRSTASDVDKVRTSGEPETLSQEFYCDLKTAEIVY